MPRVYGPDDIIVSFNGTRIDDASHFIRLLSDSKHRDCTASLVVFSNGRERTVKVPDRAGVGDADTRLTHLLPPRAFFAPEGGSHATRFSHRRAVVCLTPETDSLPAA